MKKIVFTVTNDLNYDQRMQRICTALAQNGYAITLVGFVKKKSVPLQEKIFAQHRMHILFKTGKLFFIEYNIRLFFYLLFKRFDIYGAIDLDTVIPVLINAKLKRKPCVYDAHEYYEELPEVVSRPSIHNFWKTVARYTLPSIKYNYSVSQSIAEELSKKYKQPYAVIRNVPVLVSDEITTVEKENFIIYQGAINTGRGLEELIEAMEHIDAKLIIAGEGDLSIQMRDLAAKKQYRNKIEFVGLLNPIELQKLTLHAKIGINLIAPLGLSYFYSLSNKFFDYIHAGIPQVTMDFPEYATINAEFEVAVLVDELKTETLAQAINLILSDKDLYYKFVSNTVHAKRKLNWNEEQKKLIEFYAHVA